MTLNVTSIPKGWGPASLDAVCHVRDSRRVPVNKHERSQRIAGKSIGDLYPYYGATGQVGLIDDFIFEGEHILLGEDGAPFLDPFKDKAYLVNGNFWVNNHAHILSSIISNKYVLHYLNQIDYSEHVTGTTRLKLTQGAVRRLPIVVAPADEQHRIVAKIEELFSELDKGVENLEKAREQLKVYRQAVLKHAFEGKFTAQWRSRNADQLQSPATLISRIRQEREAQQRQQLTDWKAAVGQWEAKGKEGKKPRKPKHLKSFVNLTDGEIGSLARLPSSWLWLLAESVGTIQLGRQRSPRNRSKDYPTKYIRAANITEKGLDLDDVLDMEFGPHELSAYRLEKGDLVLSEASGSAAQVGKPAIWDDQIPNCCFQNTVIRHQPYCRDHSIYLLWLYRFYYISGTFARAASGVGINHLSAYKFARLPLPLCPVLEQKEIVRQLEERFKAIQRNEREIESALEQAGALRQSILKKAFSGQLVAQNPNDEPASVLLERIKTKKVAHSQSAKLPNKRQRAKAPA